MCLNMEFFLVRIQSKCGRIRTRKNSVFGHFSRSEWLSPITDRYFYPWPSNKQFRWIKTRKENNFFTLTIMHGWIFCSFLHTNVSNVFFFKLSLIFCWYEFIFVADWTSILSSYNVSQLDIVEHFYRKLPNHGYTSQFESQKSKK